LSNILYAFLSVIFISIISLVGVFTLSMKTKTLDRILFILLSFSSGSILGTAYFDLLPEAIAFLGEAYLSITVLYITLGFVGFFFIERFIYWFHGHLHGSEHESEVDERLSVKKFVYLNVIGDGIHNLIDGMIIGASFLINIQTGLAATIAVFFHELPQEIGDFGVLVYGGFTRHKALFFNFLSALTAIIGVFLSNYFAKNIVNFFGYLLAFAAGGFIYIAASELIPEMQKEENLGRSLIQFLLFLLGIILIIILGFLFPES
jgi:zinc and cadmium transporter